MSKGKKVTIGYKYYMGMHFVICHKLDELMRIDVGEKVAWSGSVTSSSQIYINKPDLFGGEKKEGGIQGYLDVMFGEPTQQKNSYLVSKLGSIIPAFRGVLSCVFRHGLVCAMNPYVKSWRFLVKSIPAKNWYAAKADINGSANGAHIIYETLTNAVWGMGCNVALIDDDSFRATADQLFAEGLGLSFELTGTDSIENFIYTVVKHINGIFYTRPDNGKFALKLLRDDYTVSELPIYNESNILSMQSFERPSFAEMVNEVVVTFRPKGTADDDSVTVQDLAAIHAQEGIISQTVAYEGIDNATNAARVAMRDLRQKSTPLARVKLKVMRSAWNRSIGDCFRFSWTGLGITNMVLRILGANYGNLTDGAITLDCIEDVFGLPATTYIGDQTSGWVDPIQPPAAAAYRKLMEVPYWTIARNSTETELAEVTATSAFAAYSIGMPATLTMNYDFWSKPNGGSYEYANGGQFSPHAPLTAAVNNTTTSFAIGGITGDQSEIVAGGWGIIDSEIVRIDSVANGIVVVGRGCLDTVSTSHASGARLFFADESLCEDPTEYSVGDTLYGKALTRTSDGQLSLASSPEDSVAMVGRFIKPYPPGNLKLSSVAYPAMVTDDLVITWSHRDRTQQLATIIDQTAGNIGPESGVTYGLQIIDVSNGSIMESATNISGTSFASSLFFSNKNVKLNLWSVKAGRQSFQMHNYPFILNNPQNLLTQDGDAFLTEEGDLLTL